MRGMASGLVLAWLFAVLPAADVFAQATGIAGVVRDTTGAVMPGVTVEASSPALIERVRTVTTDAQGQYKILDLRPGTYEVTFTLPGFSTVKREGIELPATFTATVNADLQGRRDRRNGDRVGREPGRRHAERHQAAGRVQGHDRRDADLEELVDDRHHDDRRQQQPERRRRVGRRASEPAEGARRVVQRSPRAARRADEREHGVQLLVHRHLDQRRVDAGAELRVRRHLRRGRGRRRPGEHHPERRRQPLQRLGLLQLRQRLAAGRTTSTTRCATRA